MKKQIRTSVHGDITFFYVAWTQKGNKWQSKLFDTFQQATNFARDIK